jgi:predicted DCC family thiol-disulfide oxidoreductase YuxK
MRILPAWLRDPFYKLVARLRYTLFGEYRGKPLKESEWAERFIRPYTPYGAHGIKTKRPD